jgi:hypothetical protein
VPLEATAKQTVQKSASAKQADVALVQGDERTPLELDSASVSHSLRLECGGRGSQQILDDIERQTTVFEPRWRAWWHWEYLLRNITQRRYRIVLASHIAQFVVRVLRRLIGNPVSFLPRAADAKDHDLFVHNARLGAEPIDSLVAEVRSQNLPAIVYAIKRNYHHKDAAGFQPAIELLEEYGLHPLVLPLANFEIVRRIQIQE